MKNIVISGATGFLGSNLVKKFIDEEYHVWAVVRPDSNKTDILPEETDKFDILHCSISDIDVIVEKIGMANAWFHFAWGGVNREEIDSERVQKKNIEMSVDALKAAHALQCSVFMDAGSRVEYGITDKVMAESIECQPVNAYGKAKLQFYKIAADLCKEYNLKYCHLRFFSVYGYGDHPWSIISTLLRELPLGNKVSLSACQHKWNFMYIDDAVEAVYQLYVSVDRKKELTENIFNIASADTRKLKAFVQELYEIVGRKGELEYGSFEQAKEGALSIVPDIQRLYQVTDGWKENYSFDRGIREALRKGNNRTDEEN